MHLRGSSSLAMSKQPLLILSLKAFLGKRVPPSRPRHPSPHLNPHLQQRQSCRCSGTRTANDSRYLSYLLSLRISKLVLRLRLRSLAVPNALAPPGRATPSFRSRLKFFSILAIEPFGDCVTVMKTLMLLFLSEPPHCRWLASTS